MNDLSTELKTHWIITHKNVHLPITAEQEAKLASIGLDDLINIEGNSIKGSSISEVLTNAKYYETYPEKQPRNYGQPYTETPQYEMGPDKILDYASKSQKNLEAFIRGLKTSITRMKYQRQTPKHSLELLKKAESRLARFAVDKLKA